MLKNQAVQDLYPTQGCYRCTQCGLRVQNENSQEHLDSHFREKTQKQVASRRWLPPAQGWDSRRSPASPEKQQPDKPEQDTEQSRPSRPKLVVQNLSGLVRCSRCKDSIDTEWDESEDEWVVSETDVVTLGDDFVHSQCT